MWGRFLFILVLVCNRLESADGVLPLWWWASGCVPSDTAWQEHGYWFPFCVYVRYVKGHAFYSECLKYRKGRYDTVDTNYTSVIYH